MRFFFLACLLALGCRERLPETKGLAQARAEQAKGPTQGGGALRAGAAPDELDKHLRGGKLVFGDDFERTELGDKWQTSIKQWKLTRGEIINRFAENDGLWLLEKLPDGDLRIEFDVRSDRFKKKSQGGTKKEFFPGDLKCEAFNTEPKHQTGYVFIFGGWNNRVNRIARLEEHGTGPGAVVIDGPEHKVEAGHTYRIKILRVGTTLGFYADDKYLVHYTDPQLIRGPYFGFNNWQSHLTFDNVAIYKLGAKPDKKKPPTPPRAKSSTP